MKGTSMTTATTLESKETVSLIASDKVEGTAVYGTDDKKIGKLERVMIDKISGKVAYAVLSFGGFLGMGEDYCPDAVVHVEVQYEPRRLSIRVPRGRS
jgi:hypothetical protein